MTAARVPVPCPVCGTGVVSVFEAVWVAVGHPRRSVWADEPLRCSRGCLLPPEGVRRVLASVYDGHAGAVQLPLLDAAG